MRPEAGPLVRYGTRFWIVSPRFLGLTQGATGLDTLIRDAYISFTTPDGENPQLPSGSQVIGNERPPSNADVGLEPFERGDLAMTLLVPENHDLAPGARVLFRGVPTGELRGARLAPMARTCSSSCAFAASIGTRSPTARSSGWRGRACRAR
jgi:paraquat-inducible protein B